MRETHKEVCSVLDLDLEDSLPFASFSDDLEALHDQELEIALEHKRQETVIQHRRWKVAEVFRSEADQSSGIPSSQPTGHQLQSLESSTLSATDFWTVLPASSPPELKMPYLSSPVAYPSTSSPPRSPSPKRKRAQDKARSPLRDVATNAVSRQAMTIFEEESDDEQEALQAMREVDLPRKRAKFDGRPSASEPSRPSLGQSILSNGHASLFRESTLQEPLEARAPNQQGHFPAKVSQVPKSSTSTTIRTTSGKGFYVGRKISKATIPYEELIAARSEAEPGRARRSYYGIEINTLMDEAAAEAIIKDAQTPALVLVPTIETVQPALHRHKSKKTLLWTEKYRARKFTDLVGDDRTHRSVMHWLKRWDPIVFPGSARPKSKAKTGDDQDAMEKPHRKILLLTGPPGLGKTTLAHVCAKQAGYEVQEINASDERSSNVVKGRIRDMVGTENVKGVDTKTVGGTIRKAGRPVCVIVDEVDGVVGGSGGSGEGGFVKALIDLVMLDQRNSQPQSTANPSRKKKGDNFRLLRPLVLICNDVYHPSLRPLRQSAHAEIVHVGKAALPTVVSRLQSIFEREQVPFDGDGVRRLCEASWGVTSRKEGGSGNDTGEGDIRSILVVGEWVANRLRATKDPAANSMQRLTKKWIEDNVMADLAHGGGSARALGRGGFKEVVERVFKEGAGFSKSSLSANHGAPSGITGVKGVAEAAKSQATHRLREMIDTSGDSDRIMSDCFTAYPSHQYQDDNFLTKPDAAYDWLQFHDSLSSKVFGSSEWELAPYLSQPILAFHHLFATPISARFSQSSSTNNWRKNDAGESTSEEQDMLPFSGPQASYAAHEAQKHNHALLQSLQSALSLPLIRLFASTPDIATDLLPYLLRMLSPGVNPVIVSAVGADKFAATASVRKASEKLLVTRAVQAMTATGVRFERSRIEPSFGDSGGNGAGASAAAIRAPMLNAGWVYRMEPALDVLGAFETGGKAFGHEGKGVGTRYAVRQVLEQEWKRESVRRAEEARKQRYRAGGAEGEVEELAEAGRARDVVDPVAKKKTVIKKDFFGRVVADAVAGIAGADGGAMGAKGKNKKAPDEEEGRIWVSFNEGFSNAVRKPVTLAELMKGF